MLTPDYIRDMCRKLRVTAQEMEDDIIAEIVALLMALEVTDTVDIITASTKITQIVEQYRLIGIREIRELIRDATVESVQSEAQATQAAQEIADELPKEPLSPETHYTQPDIHDPYVRNLMGSIDRQTEATWTNLSNTQAYAGIRRYVQAANQAVVETATGEKSWSKARQDAIQQLIDEGIPCVTGPSGRTDTVAVAMERNTRTAVCRLSGDITLHNCMENGIDLVLVSAHYGARPTHEVWQGKVYSLKGKTDKYDDFFTATEYGTITGLCGINCRHSFSAFAEGMHNPYADKDYTDPQRYKDEQHQRALERKIRHLKRQKSALQEEYKATGDKDVKTRLQSVTMALRVAKAEYERFCKEHDFRPLWERTRA